MKFFSVTKPGIIFGNIVTVSGGYFLGYQHQFHWLTFLATLVGMCFVIASGCVFNNVIDRDIDKLMERTKNRALVLGLISKKIALIYATFLGIIGFLILALGSNLLTVLVAFIGWFFYVVVYSLCSKRQTTYGTLIGSIAGAVPPVVGYCAITNHFDLAAILLFLILFFWQIPHFYAIAICLLKDYQAASIPILPLKKSIPHTKIVMLIYTIIFTIVAVLPSVFGYTGAIYFVVSLAIGLAWLYFVVQGFTTRNDIKWARKVFGFSIIAIMLLSVLMLVKHP